MAKLNAPLFSFAASGKIADSLVFFGWKGLNVARSYVVPANPQTAAQRTQRDYVTAAVAAIHDAQALAANPLGALDIVAYALLGSTHPTPRTWFNEVVKRWIDQSVAGLHSAIFRDGSTDPGNTQLQCQMWFTEDGANSITAGNFWYGTSKTALVNSKEATIAADKASVLVTGLTNGVKYYIQFRPTAHADFVGVRSGIFHGTPSA